MRAKNNVYICSLKTINVKSQVKCDLLFGNVDCDFDFDIVAINDSTWSYSASSDVAVTTTKQRFGKVKYRLATDNDGGTEYFYISRNKLLEVANEMIETAKSFGIDSVALDSVSNISYSDYNYQKYSNHILLFFHHLQKYLH